MKIPFPRGRILGGIMLAVLFVSMVFDTTVVEIGSAEDARKATFSPQSFGEQEFPKVQAAVRERAVDVRMLVSALEKDQAAALEQYGVEATIGSVISIKFTGIIGEGNAGIYSIILPEPSVDIKIQIQMGPAINGTALRDATGMIHFGQFRNQIEYQDAGSALNNAMKKEVLSKINTSDLTGQTISVVGAFLFINPKNWLITPVQLSIES